MLENSVSDNDGLVNQLLMANPKLDDQSVFDGSVSIICQHNTDGAIGLILNKPKLTTEFELFRDLDFATDKLLNPARPVYKGGPLQNDTGFVLHTPCKDKEWESSMKVSDTLFVTSSKDVLKAISLNENAPEHYQIIVGFSSWEKGQIESELEESTWFHTETDLDLIFNTDVEHKWQNAIDSMIVSPARISPNVGHA